jgi:hypothetical protein
MAEIRNQFIHHVFFWLRDPGNKKNEEELIQGLRKLSKVKTIKNFHIGRPADTNREVIERSYSISWCLFFDNPIDQDHYQTDPIHLDFVKECSHLWSKVIVHDSVNA